MTDLVISKEEFLRIMDCVRNKIDMSIREQLVISEDYYLNIPMQAAYDLSKQPEPTIGSLVDDWQSLRALLSEDSTVTFVDVDRFAAILLAISEAIVPTTDEFSE